MILLYKNIDFKEYRVYIVLDFFIFDFDFNCDYIISCFVYWNIVYVDYLEYVYMIVNINFIIEILFYFFIMILKVFF